MEQKKLESVLFQIQGYNGEGDFGEHVLTVLNHTNLELEEAEEMLRFVQSKRDKDLPMMVRTYWVSVEKAIESWMLNNF